MGKAAAVTGLVDPLLDTGKPYYTKGEVTILKRATGDQLVLSI
jgi:hypothetical protein